MIESNVDETLDQNKGTYPSHIGIGHASEFDIVNQDHILQSKHYLLNLISELCVDCGEWILGVGARSYSNSFSSN